MTHEREITEPVDLCLPSGRLRPDAVGWSRRPLHHANLRGWGRNKRWEYWGIVTPTHVVGLVASSLDYAGVHSLYVLDDTPSRSKLDPKGKPGVFVGYSDTQKAWRVYIPARRTVINSTHVTFDDRTGTHEDFQAEGEIQFRYREFHFDDEDTPPIALETPVPVPPPAPAAIPTPPAPTLAATSYLPTPPVSTIQAKPTRRARQPRPLPPPRPPSERIQNLKMKDTKGKAPAKPSVPTIIEDTEHEASSADSSVDADASHSEPEADTQGESAADDSTEEQALLATGDEPRNYREAMQSPNRRQWQDAMDTEIESIIALGTFELIDPPKGANIIDTTWAFKHKPYTIDSLLELFKARLCARGYAQIPGEDFFKTFAPVAKTESTRLLYTIAAMLDWEIDIVDVNSAFLNSDMPEDQPVYVRQPAGYVAKGKEHMVWRLRKALYGLKQSGRLWYQKLRSILVELGFRVCISDPCVFYRIRPSAISFVASHVDDLSLICSTRSETLALKREIAQHVPIKDGGGISLMLGVEYTRDRAARTISLSHRKYIDAIVETYHLSDANPAPTPLAPGTILSKDDCPQTPEDIEAMRKVPYQNAVGALNHIAVMTRPDIAFAVHKVAQFNSNPGPKHWSAVKRIIRYLKGTRDHVLTLGGQSDSALTITAYSDADFANSKDHGRSVSGYAMMLGNGCFSWSAKKQTVVALSTAQAEYNAALHAGREVLWLRQLRLEIGFPLTVPTPLRIDNTSTISIISNPEEVSKRSKHFRLTGFWLSEEAEAGTFDISHVESASNLADIFTKALPPDTHWRLAKQLGLTKGEDAR